MHPSIWIFFINFHHQYVPIKWAIDHQIERSAQIDDCVLVPALSVCSHTHTHTRTNRNMNLRLYVHFVFLFRSFWMYIQYEKLMLAHAAEKVTIEKRMYFIHVRMLDHTGINTNTALDLFCIHTVPCECVSFFVFFCSCSSFVCLVCVIKINGTYTHTTSQYPFVHVLICGVMMYNLVWSHFLIRTLSRICSFSHCIPLRPMCVYVCVPLCLHVCVREYDNVQHDIHALTCLNWQRS